MSCHRELFHPVKPFTLKQVDGVTESPRERDRDPLRFLEQVEVATLARRPDTRAVGFKLFPGHNRTVLEHVASNESYRVVLLERENKLAQWSSTLIANQTRIWTTRSGETPPRPRINFERTAFELFVSRNADAFRRSIALLELHDKQFFSLEYVEIKNEKRIQQLLQFLALEFDGSLAHAMARVRLQKQNSERIADRFVNSAEVIDAMRELGRMDWLVEALADDAVSAAQSELAAGDAGRA